MNKLWLSGALAMIVVGSIPAQAQPSPVRDVAPDGPRIRQVPLVVEVSLNLQTPLAPGATPDEQTRQSEQIRKALYEMTARECETLKVVFKSDCRLRSVRVNSNVQTRGRDTDVLSANANATFELPDRTNRDKPD